MKYVLMTQDNCRNCEIFKTILTNPLKGAYDDKILKVHRQSNPDIFEELSIKYGVKATPTLINTETGETISDVSSGLKIKKFLEA